MALLSLAQMCTTLADDMGGEEDGIEAELAFGAQGTALLLPLSFAHHQLSQEFARWQLFSSTKR